MKITSDKTIYNDPNCPNCRGFGVYFPADPECTDCSGSGWVDEFQCTCAGGALRYCECHKRQKLQVMTARARIPAKNIPCTVAGYDPDSDNEHHNRAVVVAWLNQFPAKLNGFPGLFFTGDPGTGKTHLATAICNALIRTHDVQPLYASATQMMARATARIEDKSMSDPFASPATAHVLVLDDLGAEKPSEWSIALFAELIDSRYRNALPTIITSNLDLDGIEALYGARITDRIYEMCQILHFDGHSRRRAKGSEVVAMKS